MLAFAYQKDATDLKGRPLGDNICPVLFLNHIINHLFYRPGFSSLHDTAVFRMSRCCWFASLHKRLSYFSRCRGWQTVCLCHLLGYTNNRVQVVKNGATPAPLLLAPSTECQESVCLCRIRGIPLLYFVWIYPLRSGSLLQGSPVIINMTVNEEQVTNN